MAAAVAIRLRPTGILAVPTTIVAGVPASAREAQLPPHPAVAPRHQVWTRLFGRRHSRQQERRSHVWRSCRASGSLLWVVEGAGQH